ncbi:MAG TPA: hypothetical protein VNO24_30685 [Blastocatellia bacterium]|nr:hypothetical protein [Blastocatellia bacterium]
MQSRIFVALAVGIVLALASFTATAQKDASLRKSVMADTGIVSLGPGQVLRVTVDWGDGSAEAVVRFRRIEYSQGACNGGLCTLAMSSQTTSGPLTLMPGEGASMDISDAAFGVRGVVFSNRPDVKVTAEIINGSTGEATSHVIMANTEGDFH